MSHTVPLQLRIAPNSSFHTESDGELVQSLSRAFDRAISARTIPRLTELHECTGALARRMRASGFTPQESLILLKHAVHGHAGWRPSLLAYSAGLPESDTYAMVFDWWIRAYFAEAQES